MKASWLLAPVLLAWIPLAAGGSELDVAEVLEMPEVRAFFDGQVGKRHELAPAGLEQLGRLAGVWLADSEVKSRDGRWLESEPAVWIWKYTLGGFALQDLWVQPEDHLPAYMKTLGRSYLLTSLRLFDPASKEWRSAWAANGGGQAGGQDFGTFTAESKDGDVVLRGTSSYGEQRITFSEITDSSFVWTSEVAPTGGEWAAVMRVRARRVR